MVVVLFRIFVFRPVIKLDGRSKELIYTSMKQQRSPS